MEGRATAGRDAWKPVDNVKKPRSRVVYAGHARGNNARTIEATFDNLESAKKGEVFDEEITDE